MRQLREVRIVRTVGGDPSPNVLSPRSHDIAMPHLAEPAAPDAGESPHALVRRVATEIGREWRGLEAALRTLASVCVTVAGEPRASIWRLGDARTLRCLEHFDPETGEHTSGERIPATACPRFVDALRAGDTVVSDDVSTDVRTAELVPSYLGSNGIAGLIGVPVWEGGRWVGVLCLERTGTDAEGWTDEDVAIAEAMGDLAALAFASAGREEGDGARRESEQRHERLFDTSPVPQLEMDIRGVVSVFDDMVAAGVEDFEAHFAECPDDLARMVSRRRIRRVNAAALELYGAATSDVLPDRIADLTLPGTPELFRAAVSAWQKGRTSTRVGARHRTLDGRTLDVVLSAHLPLDATEARRAVVSVQDVTEQKASERLLTDIAQQVGRLTGKAHFGSVVDFISERLGADLSLVGELTPDGKGVRSLAVSRDGEPAQNFVYALEGTPCERVIGQGACLYGDGVEELFPDDAGLARMHARAYAGVPLSGAEGAPLGILLAAFRWPLRDISRVESILRILASRVSAELERRQAEEVRSRLEAQLVHAQRLESVGRLAGGVAHDFNNLLAPIMAYAEMASEGVDDDDPVREDLGEILVAAERAGRLTRQLLAFSRRQRLQIRSLDLNETVESFASMMSTVLRDDITFSIEPHAELPCVSCDQGQVEQVLMNLVLNAQDAMPDGGLLTVRTYRHDVPELGDGDHPNLPPGAFACLEVTDTGTGMDANALAHLFEPFFTTKDPSEGTGLGLATAYGIMQQHGGGISVQSTLGAGSTFQVFVPLCQSAAAEEIAPEESTPRPSGSERILVVEDEGVVRRLVVTVLRRHGYDVVEASDPLAALKLVRDGGTSIDLLVTDVVMPEMDGVELHTRISTLRPEIPVLFLSGYAHDVVASKGVTAMNLLAKPFSLRELTSRVREVLERAGLGGSAA